MILKWTQLLWFFLNVQKWVSSTGLFFFLFFLVTDNTQLFISNTVQVTVPLVSAG